MLDDSVSRRQAGIFLLFAPGTRPDAEDLVRLAEAPGGAGERSGKELVSFSISHRPAEHPYWLELLALGLTFDLQGLVLLAMIQFDKGELRSLAQSWRSMTAARSGRLGSDRLRRFEAVIGAMKLLLERQVAEAVTLARALAGESRDPTFEFEAACNLLALLSRLTRHELRLESLDHDVRVVAQRFAVSRTTCELLVRSLQDDAALVTIVRDAYAAICSEAEDAVSNTLNGLPSEAAKLLLARAEETLNAKLMDLALHTMDRHRPSIDGVEALRDRALALHKRYRSYGTQVSLGG